MHILQGTKLAKTEARHYRLHQSVVVMVFGSHINLSYLVNSVGLSLSVVCADSESNKGPSRPLSRSMPLGTSTNDWDMQSMQLNKLKGSLNMNAAAAALDDCPDPLHFDMNDDLSIEPHLLLNGDGDVHDPAFL